jgi:hypothetical protein
MNISKNIISDLIPLYASNECSADTRALVEEYLQRNPQQAEELRRIMNTSIPGPGPQPRGLDEMSSLRQARRVVRRRSWLLGFAIFFSLTPFSFLYTGGRAYWLLLEAPTTALIYGAVGVLCWLAYALLRVRSQIL